MKNIYNKINISPVLIILILISFLSGLFKDIIIYLSIIFFHEIGHVYFSKKYNWKIDKINFNLSGGYIVYNEIIDKKFSEEIIISISGILFQSIYFFIIFVLFKNNFFSIKTFDIFRKYYIGILIFNLIPIFPLDGSKILNVLLNNIFSYKKSLKLLNIISIVNIILIIFIFIKLDYKIEYSYVIILSFLLSSIYKNIKNSTYLFNKFLYERYLYPIDNKTYLNIKKLSNMKRQKKHYFKIKDHYYDEKKVLSKIFD